MQRPKQSEHFKQILSRLEGKTAVIAGHIKPDGDCLGSQIALCRTLNSLGINASIYLDKQAPYFLEPFIKDTPTLISELPEITTDTICLAVDCADFKRLCPTLAAAFPKPLLSIDHHETSLQYAEENIIDPKASATAEILAEILIDLDLTIDPTAAQALYIGIATDTGQFQYNSTTLRTFEAASKLLKLGANPSEASEILYNRNPVNKYQLLGKFLDTLTLICDNRVCYGQVTHAMYEETGTNRADTEGLVDYTRAIEGVDIGLLIEETNTGTKVSLRSKDPKIRVDTLAQQFNGGGHKCAAGLHVEMPPAEFIPQLLESIKKHLNNE